MAPYLRIAQAIRERIARGELAVGERAPSVREIAREWKVATATAAHALRTLADEGVLRAVPRVGSIVASPRTRRRESKPRAEDLGRTRIVTAAIEIADQEGLPALSLRGVAAKVGIPVMSLYRHVRSKDELLRAMTDRALGEEKVVVRRGWRARVEEAARAEWRTFRRHPWLARVLNITRPEPLPNSIAYAELIFGALAETGADAATQMRVHLILHSFVQGMAVNVEVEASLVSETGMSDEEWMHTRTQGFEFLAASGRYPSFAKVLASHDMQGFELDFDTLFERGLKALLDGFTPLFE